MTQRGKDEYRARHGLMLPTFCTVRQRPAEPAAGRSMPAGMLVTVDSGMITRATECRIRRTELFGRQMCSQLHPMIARRFPRTPHVPRITIDRLTIVRETWDQARDMPFCELKDEHERFAAVQLEHGKILTVEKPCA
jgi:hypothetical protein